MNNGAQERYDRAYDDLARSSNRLEEFALVAMAGTTVAHLVLERSHTGATTDHAFLAILLVATALLIAGERFTRVHFLRRGLRFLRQALPTEPEADAAHFVVSREIYSSTHRTVCGAGYGALIATAPWLVDIWGDLPILKLTLSLVLFFANYVTGNALFSLVRFVARTRWLASFVRIDVWNPISRSAEFYVQSIVYVAFFAGLYVSMSMTSILFSPFRSAEIVGAYVLFSFGLLFGATGYAYAPVFYKLRTEKRGVYEGIARRLRVLSDRVLANADEHPPSRDLEEIGQLLSLRRTVENSSVLPVRGALAIIFGGIAFVMSQPLLVGWLLHTQAF